MTGVPSSRFSQVSASVILQRSSPSRLSTSSPTSSVKFTSTISPVVSVKSSLVSRMSTPYLSTFASRKSVIIFISSLKSSISLSFITSGSFIDTASLSLSRTIVTPFISRLLSFKSQNVTSSSPFSTPFRSLSLSIFVTSSFSRKVKSSLSLCVCSRPFFKLYLTFAGMAFLKNFLYRHPHDLRTTDCFKP